MEQHRREGAAGTPFQHSSLPPPKNSTLPPPTQLAAATNTARRLCHNNTLPPPKQHTDATRARAQHLRPHIGQPAASNVYVELEGGGGGGGAAPSCNPY